MASSVRSINHNVGLLQLRSKILHLQKEGRSAVRGGEMNFPDLFPLHDEKYQEPLSTGPPASRARARARLQSNECPGGREVSSKIVNFRCTVDFMPPSGKFFE